MGRGAKSRGLLPGAIIQNKRSRRKVCRITPLTLLILFAFFGAKSPRMALEICVKSCKFADETHGAGANQRAIDFGARIAIITVQIENKQAPSGLTGNVPGRR